MDRSLLNSTLHLPSSSREAWTDTTSDNAPQSHISSSKRGENLRLFGCYALHAGLVAVHIVLLGLVLAARGQLITMSVEQSEKYRFPLLVTLVLQCLGTAYLAVLVVMTQKLALCRDFRTQQTLSAIHDKSSAWLGLGSSAFSLWHQVKVPAAVSGVMQIALYLLGTFVLHITIPTLASVVTYTVVNSPAFPTRLAYNRNFTLSPLAYNILGVYDQLETPGLLNNTIYDVIPIQQAAVGNVMVNSTSFTVGCVSLPGANQTDFNADGANNPVYDFDLTPSSTYEFPPPVFQSLKIVSQFFDPGDGTSDDMRYSTIVMSTVPILDGSGDRGPMTRINPAVISTDDSSGSSPSAEHVISAVQLISCDVTLENRTIPVNAFTGQPLSAISTDSVKIWKNWTLPNVPSDPLLSLLNTFGSLAPPGNYPQYGNIKNVLNTSQSTDGLAPFDLPPYNPSAVEGFVMEDLGLFTQEVDNVSLVELERSMAKAVAAVLWFQLNMNATSKYGDQFQAATPLQGEATISLLETRNRLNLNIIPIAVGLGASCLLLGLAISLTRRSATTEAHPVVESAGILELTWLLGNEPHISRVRDARLENLRAAGMFEVHMSERAKRRLQEADTDAEKLSFLAV